MVKLQEMNILNGKSTDHRLATVAGNLNPRDNGDL